MNQFASSVHPYTISQEREATPVSVFIKIPKTEKMQKWYFLKGKSECYNQKIEPKEYLFTTKGKDKRIQSEFSERY